MFNNDRRQSEALDRHITGNYGENQLEPSDNYDGDHQWHPPADVELTTPSEQRKRDEAELWACWQACAVYIQDGGNPRNAGNFYAAFQRWLKRNKETG